MSLYFKSCDVDLADYEIPDYYTQSYTASGASSDFVLSQYPTSPDINAITYTVTVDGTATTAYTFTESTKTFSLTSIPTVGQTVVCSYEFIGQFNNLISNEIAWILAYGMIIGWLSGKMYNPSKMKERLSLKDWNSSHSPANLLKELRILYEMAQTNLRNLVVSYSFNSGYNFDEE